MGLFHFRACLDCSLKHTKMNILKIRFRKKVQQNNDALNAHIQPFTQKPCVNNEGPECADRIDAHDLFSHYTAEIIKEDTVFIR